MIEYLAVPFPGQLMVETLLPFTDAASGAAQSEWQGASATNCVIDAWRKSL
jgi:hypothetical protein